jgi:cytochrome c peroxidase
MTKKIIYSIFAVAVLGTVACEQSFTAEETYAQANRLKSEEINKQYNYSKVQVQKGFETQGLFLSVQDPKDANTFGKVLTEGENLSISGVSDAQAKLGRVLFYDTKLSLNNAISCGSCHHQAKGFADGLKASPGFEGKTTPRNSMAISNPAMSHSGLFWDRRENSVLSMSLRPVQNHIEMGMEDLSFLERKLSAIDYYPSLFKEAYPSNPIITKDNISKAISAFVRSMVSWNSKFDEGVKTNFANFTPEEKRGKEIFMGKNIATTTTSTNNVFVQIDEGACGGCHGAPMFNDGSNLHSRSAYDDNGSDGNGRGVSIGLDKVSADIGTGDGSFKIPSLRNIELTAPYMHDGRFKTLEEVVTHYNENIQPSKNLHRKLKDSNGKPKKLNLSPSDQKALVAFLKTLTDKSFTTDPKFSNPFEN